MLNKAISVFISEAVWEIELVQQLACVCGSKPSDVRSVCVCVCVCSSN